jgi:hypothetical protein
VNQFDGDLQKLLESLKNEAAAGGSLRKFAAGNASAPNFMTLYALVHCTPDLSHQQCIGCLDDATKAIPQCCAGKEGGRVIMPSCNIRFEVYSFFDSTAPLSTNYSTTSKAKGTPFHYA